MLARDPFLDLLVGGTWADRLLIAAVALRTPVSPITISNVVVISGWISSAGGASTRFLGSRFDWSDSNRWKRSASGLTTRALVQTQADAEVG